MAAEFVEDMLGGPLTRGVLLDLKTRGLRRRVWFRVLDRMERGLVDLTIRWVDRVRNAAMARVLVRILRKLARALETGMARVLVVGRELALKASVLAVEWGNCGAYGWRLDRGFWVGLGRAATLERAGKGF